MVEEKIVQSGKVKRLKNGPVITWLICAICVFIFLGLSSAGNSESQEPISKWGYLAPEAIWDGKYWGLISSVFVHLEVWHMFFNVYWLWILGGLLEKHVGPLRYIAFFLMAAFISSGIQLAVSGSTGIGASGVVYAIFGYIWVTRNRVVEFQNALSKQMVVVFIVWLFICLITTYLNIWKVGNAAHFSGILFGVLVADAFYIKSKLRLAFAGLIVLLVCSVVPLFWAPWSAAWVGDRAYKAHLKEDYTAAVSLYHRSLELGEDPIWVWSNLVRLYKKTGDQAKYEEALRMLQKLDVQAAESLK